MYYKKIHILSVKAIESRKYLVQKTRKDIEFNIQNEIAEMAVNT